MASNSVRNTGYETHLKEMLTFRFAKMPWDVYRDEVITNLLAQIQCSKCQQVPVGTFDHLNTIDDHVNHRLSTELSANLRDLTASMNIPSGLVTLDVLLKSHDDFIVLEWAIKKEMRGQCEQDDPAVPSFTPFVNLPLESQISEHDAPNSVSTDVDQDRHTSLTLNENNESPMDHQPSRLKRSSSFACDNRDEGFGGNNVDAEDPGVTNPYQIRQMSLNAGRGRSTSTPPSGPICGFPGLH